MQVLSAFVLIRSYLIVTNINNCIKQLFGIACCRPSGIFRKVVLWCSVFVAMEEILIHTAGKAYVKPYQILIWFIWSNYHCLCTTIYPHIVLKIKVILVYEIPRAILKKTGILREFMNSQLTISYQWFEEAFWIIIGVKQAGWVNSFSSWKELFQNLEKICLYRNAEECSWNITYRNKRKYIIQYFRRRSGRYPFFC